VAAGADAEDGTEAEAAASTEDEVSVDDVAKADDEADAIEAIDAPTTLSLKTRSAYIQHFISILDLLGLAGVQSALHVTRITHIAYSDASIGVGAVINAVSQSSSLCLLERDQDCLRKIDLPE
jgi:hypothetical protein